MTTRYARFNLQLVMPAKASVITDWHQQLHDAAIEGCADDFEVFYNEDSSVIGVSVPYEINDEMSLLEAGLVLGYCTKYYEDNSDADIFSHVWCSLHDADGTVVQSLI